MSRTSTNFVVATVVALAVVLAVVGGPVGVVAALVAIAIVGLTWSRNRPVVNDRAGRWWKLLLGGAGLLASLVVITAATGELSSGGWLLAMAVGLTSVVLMATGLAIGITSRTHT